MLYAPLTILVSKLAAGWYFSHAIKRPLIVDSLGGGLPERTCVNLVTLVNCKSS